MKNILFQFVFLFVAAIRPIFSEQPSKLDKTYVGELQEKWRLPSDHLPIGVTFKSEKNVFHLISWNVLNATYLNWIYDNSQGLARSILTEENFPIKETGLTRREDHVIDSLLEMIHSPNLSVLCLQECSEIFIQELGRRLPSQMKIVRSSDTPVKNQNILIYDTGRFQFVEKSLHLNAFPSEPGRPQMEVVLEKEGVRYRLYNAHLRCDPSKPQRFDLGELVYALKEAGDVVIILGDLNVEQDEMAHALSVTAPRYLQKNSFIPLSPYRTTISPELYSKAIDHIFVDLGGNFLEMAEMDANEVLGELQKSVDLLSDI